VVGEQQRVDPVERDQIARCGVDDDPGGEPGPNRSGSAA
jgi:hypothetical protein